MSRHESKVTIHLNRIENAHVSRETLIQNIKAEPMLFRADPGFAFVHGDLLTMDFLHAAKDLWGNLDGCIVDSRHHMLMPGMVPCIPGWHTDDAPRSKDYCDGQPNIFTPEYVTEHLLCVVDAGTGSLTEFLDGPVELPQGDIERAYKESGRTFYKSADTFIERGLVAKDCVHLQPASGDIVQFDAHSWHRGMPAKARGFRFFIRITRNSKHKVENELRSNAQVYITDTSYGW
ncbi:hypothetical protein CFB82_19940 [Burkholderia sp. HI2714]|uniref:hypothetical protein n=1 Tax=Burkholderia sp. HI2714 TaxID=2015359 RepID=UPI000B7A900B|nr:hypothetical protein [Burkholderia sp. HI2714]OXJ32659.1 hypothetical protein CFB82_19940 [Burkholderia sp. HI2714]